MRLRFAFLLAFCHALLFADTDLPPPNHAPDPWLTGPLIAPSGEVVPYGEIEVEPYVYFTTITGAYNQDWQAQNSQNKFFVLNTQLFLYFGLTPWLDINVVPQFFYDHCGDENSVNFGDLTVGLDFQLLDSSYTPYFPGIKLGLRETFPTGPYQNLNPKKLLTDQTGQGTYATTFNLVIYKVYYFGHNHFFSTTYSAAYTINTPVHVHGLNVYGGAPGMTATALPGSLFQAVISFEFSISRHIAFAIDNVYLHVNRTRFVDVTNPSQISTPGGFVIPSGLPSSEQISFAPAIEYNWNENYGICVGCWFSNWGRNAPIFRSAIIDVVLNF